MSPLTAVAVGPLTAVTHMVVTYSGDSHQTSGAQPPRRGLDRRVQWKRRPPPRQGLDRRERPHGPINRAHRAHSTLVVVLRELCPVGVAMVVLLPSTVLVLVLGASPLEEAGSASASASPREGADALDDAGAKINRSS